MIVDPYVIAVLFALSAWRPFWGLTALWGWLLFGDRWAAHVHASVGGIPLYTAESVLLGLLLHGTMIILRDRRWRTSFPFARSWSPAWTGFYVAGGLSALRGFAVYPLTRVVRDAALAYYSVFAHLTARLVRSEERLRILATVSAAVIVAKAIIAFLLTHSGPQQASFQPAAISLSLGCLLLVSIFTIPLWMSRRSLGWVLACFLSVILFFEYLVRSSWSGMAVALFFYGFSIFYYRLGWRPMRGIVATSLVIVGFIAALYTPTLPMPDPRPWTSTFVSVSAVQDPVALLRAETPSMPAVRNRPEQMAIAETVGDPGLAVTPAPQRPKTPEQRVTETPQSVSQPAPTNAVLAELGSFFDGLRSNNVITRLLFWVEVIEEVFSTRLPFFRAFIRDPYHMTHDIRTLLVRTHGSFQLDGEINEPVKRFLSVSPVLRLLNGVPFGKTFMPRRVFWWLHETTRFDPHNSHLAVLYRMGLLGFISYLALLVVSFIRAHRYVQRAPHLKAKLIELALMACLLFYVIHTVTDVTLENPYKGIPFWVILGLLQAVPEIYPNS